MLHHKTAEYGISCACFKHTSFASDIAYGAKASLFAESEKNAHKRKLLLDQINDYEVIRLRKDLYAKQENFALIDKRGKSVKSSRNHDKISFYDQTFDKILQSER